MCPATTETAKDKVQESLDKVLGKEDQELDLTLCRLNRQEALKLDKRLRLRWFYLIQLIHSELECISEQLGELLDPSNETRIITIIGPTGIGKTTLAHRLVATVIAERLGRAGPSELPSIYVKAPANGEKSLSWTNLYLRILAASAEPCIEKKREFELSEGVLRLKSSKTLGALRESLEAMLEHRKVKLLIIDEALHLLRFSNYEAVMDTLKSLGDAGDAKLLLIGDYTLVEAATQYGQVARRAELLHYRRYLETSAPDRKEFGRAVERLQALWPCDEVPQFTTIKEELMRASLGSVGMLKSLLLKGAFLQMERAREDWSVEILAKAAKSRKLLETIEREIVAGEKRIAGHCYGESMFASADVMRALASKMEATHA